MKKQKETGASFITKATQSKFVLLFIFCFALFLQFFRLGERSLWEDEARLLLKTYWSLQDTLLFQKNLLFNVTLSGWSRFLKGEFWFRIPSVLFALFSLIALYEVGKRLFSPPVSRLGVFLCSISPFFLLESRQVKMYSLVLFLSLVSLYFLILFLQTHRLGALVGHLGVSLMAFLTHYMFIPFYLVQVVFVLGSSLRQKRKVARRYLAALCVIVCCSFFLLLNLFKHVEVLKLLYAHPSNPETLSFPAGYFGKVAFVLYLFIIGPTIFPWKWGWVLGGGILFIIPFFYSFKGWPRDSFKLTFSAFAAPILFLSLLQNAQPHYCFISLPFCMLLLASGLFALKPFTRAFFISGLILVNTYGLVNYFSGRQYLFITHLEPYREISQKVLEEYQPGDYLLHTQLNPTFNYYFHRFYEKKGVRGRLHSVDKEGVLYLMTWEKVVKKFPPGTKRIWFIERSPGQFIENEFPISNAEQIYRENLAFRSFLEGRFKRLGRWGYLKDPDIEKKKRFLKKFYMEERVTVSLYSLLDPA